MEMSQTKEALKLLKKYDTHKQLLIGLHFTIVYIGGHRSQKCNVRYVTDFVDKLESL